MRLKAEMWVMAYVRRVNGAGAMAMVVKRGDADAGAIYIKLSEAGGGPAWREDRKAALYGPAPSGIDEAGSDRRWVCLHDAATLESVVDTTLDRQRKFDADIWIIEVDDRDARHFLEDWLMTPVAHIPTSKG
jgi:hypothetical protein